MYLWLCNRPMPRLVGAHWPGSFASILNFIDSPYSFPSEVEEEGGEASYHNDQNPADNVLWGKNDETASLRAEVRELRESSERAAAELAAVRQTLAQVLAKL